MPLSRMYVTVLDETKARDLTADLLHVFFKIIRMPFIYILIFYDIAAATLFQLSISHNSIIIIYFL